MIAGALPAIIYWYFIQGRLRILYDEYQQNLRRLGFPGNAKLSLDKFDALYGTAAQFHGPRVGAELGNSRVPPNAVSDSRTQSDGATESQPILLATLARSPVLVATPLSLVGWLLVFYPASDGRNVLAPNPEPLAYGFLGAYIFGLGSLVRQYVTDDLQPRYYASLTNRYLTVFILSWMIHLMVQPQAGPSLLAAFAVGLFPTFGLRMAERLGTKLLGVVSNSFKEKFPLTRLDGLNAYQEDRLLLEGIENLQSLTTARIVDLMLRTRYPVEQLIDWMDQAVLHLHARDHMERFQGMGLRTATDLLDAYGMPETSQDELPKRRESLVQLLSKAPPSKPADVLDKEDTKALLETIAASLLYDPNMFHIRYWRSHEYDALPEDFERMRTRADLKLMQGLPEEAIGAYNDLLQAFPNYHTARLYRGLAYFMQKKYQQALEDYTWAIERGGDVWENVRYAYLEKGRALREQGEPCPKILENYKKSKNYQGFPEALFERAFDQMTSAEQRYDEAITNFQAVIEQGFKVAEAYANTGFARHKRWQASGRLLESRGKELGQASEDLRMALRLNRDLV